MTSNTIAERKLRRILNRIERDHASERHLIMEFTIEFSREAKNLSDISLFLHKLILLSQHRKPLNKLLRKNQTSATREKIQAALEDLERKITSLKNQTSKRLSDLNSIFHMEEYEQAEEEKSLFDESSEETTLISILSLRIYSRYRAAESQQERIEATEILQLGRKQLKIIKMEAIFNSECIRITTTITRLVDEEDFLSAEEWVYQFSLSLKNKKAIIKKRERIIKRKMDLFRRLSFLDRHKITLSWFRIGLTHVTKKGRKKAFVLGFGRFFPGRRERL